MRLRGEERAPVLDSVCGVLALAQDDSVCKSWLRPWFRLTGAGVTQSLSCPVTSLPFPQEPGPSRVCREPWGSTEHRRIITDILHPQSMAKIVQHLLTGLHLASAGILPKAGSSSLTTAYSAVGESSRC